MNSNDDSNVLTEKLDSLKIEDLEKNPETN